MHSAKTLFSGPSNRLKPAFKGVTLATLITSTSLFSPTIFAADAQNGPMSLAILGALGSLGFACYQGKAPCSLSPGINTDQLTFSLDLGEDSTLKHARIALGANWQEKIYEANSWEIAGRWEVNLNHWDSTLSNPNQDTGYMLGITPVFHYQLKNRAITPFIEMGGGPQLLSNVTVENEFKSTQFQFGSIFGLGVKTADFEVGYRYLHISNAGIEMPNPGTDFHNIHVGYYF